MVSLAVIGAGPAGLAAAEVAASRLGPGPEGRVTVYDWTPSPARKFLMAGKSGLNIANRAEGAALTRAYGAAEPQLTPMLSAFGSAEVVAWCRDLGQSVFTGPSGRVFPEAMKASPLLRAWLARLDGLGVRLERRHRWLGWDGEGRLRFEAPGGERRAAPSAVVLALGGASWPRLGSDAAWTPALEAAGAALAPFAPSNVGAVVDWSAGLAERAAGQPLKNTRFEIGGRSLLGEAVVTRYGLEGGAIYTLGRRLRAALAEGAAVLTLDLAPARSAERLARDLARQPAKASLSTKLRKAARLDPVKTALLREAHGPLSADPPRLAAQIKAAPIRITGLRPIAEAISSAGGLCWSSLDERLMLRARPGVFAAGEMIDWDAPTGGYLLTACLATGRWAGAAAADWALAAASPASA